MLTITAKPTRLLKQTITFVWGYKMKNLDLMGARLIYVGSECMPNIPFNIVGPGDLSGTVKVSTWEGRNHLGQLMDRTVGDHTIGSIKELIKAKHLINNKGI